MLSLIIFFPALQDGHLVYEAELYVQLDQHVQQAGDQALRVRCSRDALLVSGRLGRGPESKPQSSAGGSADVEGWMDILRGSMPLVKPLSGHVNVGDPMTMLIKIRHKGIRMQRRPMRSRNRTHCVLRARRCITTLLHSLVTSRSVIKVCGLAVLSFSAALTVLLLNIC